MIVRVILQRKLFKWILYNYRDCFANSMKEFWNCHGNVTVCIICNNGAEEKRHVFGQEGQEGSWDR